MLIATLKNRNFPAISFLGLIAFLCAGLFATAQESNTPPVSATAPAATAAVPNQDVLRSSLEVQEQLRNLQAADEKDRKESAEAMANLKLQMDVVQSTVASQKLTNLMELQDLYTKAQNSYRPMLEASIAFACFGCLVLLFAAYLQWQMVNRVRTIAASLPTQHALEAGHTPAALGMGDSPLVASQGLERSTAQFLGAMERLEKRLREMEATTAHHPAHSLPGDGTQNGDALVLTSDSEPMAAEQNGVHAPEAADKFSLLLSKGQTLLKLDQTDEALNCFDEILATHPGHAEALLGRGTALERHQRLTEAIECYDRAIASDASMTMAYLHKGGVFNRMERYSEALECYEQALKSQDKSRVPEPAAA